MEEIDQKKEDYDKCEGTLLRINKTETLGIDSSNMSYRHGVDPFSFHSNATVMAWKRCPFGSLSQLSSLMYAPFVVSCFLHNRDKKIRDILNFIFYIIKYKMSRMPVIVPPIIVKGKSFTIYGENHNDIDNKFYERMTFDDTHRVLVEHSTYKPFLQIEEITLRSVPDKKSLIANMKGAEWIYLTRLVGGKPVEPIDIRVENGFPTARQESTLYELARSDPFQFLDFIREKLKVIAEHKEAYNKPGIKEVYHSIHTIFKQQLGIFIKNLEQKVLDLDNIDKICKNIRSLGTLFFDSNLLEIILANNRKRTHKKELAIFVGARHAINLFHFLQENGVKELEIEKTEKGELMINNV